MPKRKRGSGGGGGGAGGGSKKGDRGWGALPWRTVQVEEGGLGEADDCFAFTIEEVDGAAYMMERDALGGFKVKPHGSQQGQVPAQGKKQKTANGQSMRFEPGEPTGPAEGVVVEDIQYVNEGASKALVALEAQPQQAEAAVGGEDGGEMPANAKKDKKQKKKKDKQKQKQQQAPAEAEGDEEEEENGPAADAPAAPITLDEAELQAALPAWAAKAMGGVSLHPLLLHNLRRQGFEAPTPIQRVALPLAMGVPGGPQGKDVMGAAETGSGKTLAYGLPILDHLLKQRDRVLGLPEGAAERALKERGRQYLAALVLCPTRELALQVTAHLQAMLEGDPVPGRARVNVVSVVGGLSETKQARLLGRRPEVVVATVGRFWELVQGNEAHLRDLGRLRFFVLDEADRMVEDGHFPELTRLLGSILAQGKSYQKDYDEIRRGKKLAANQAQEQRRAAQQQEEEEEEEDAAASSSEEEDEAEAPSAKPQPKKPRQGKQLPKAAAEAEEEEERESDEEDLMSPVEIPTKSLADAIAEAKRMGIKLEGVHGLEGEGGDEEGSDAEEVDVELSEEEDEEERESEGSESGGAELEAEMMEVDDVKGDLEADVTPQEDPASWRELPPPVVRQALIFSATLSMPAALREGKKGKKGKKGKGGGGGGKDGGESVVHRIMKEVGMRGQPAVVDLSGAATADSADSKKALALPPGLELCFIKTVGGQKDAYLYYFLRRYPGRSLVFTNSIDQTRRLAQLLAALRLPARALHAKQQQRQRLKSLDAFRSQKEAVLVATDVAARGLDIPAVDHVIHYDLPRSLEVFVHRAGRTARAQRQGLSFSLVAPRDERMHADVCRLLEAGEEKAGTAAAMAPFPVDLQELNAVRERVGLAGRIVGYDQEQGSKQASQSWFLKAARDADLELDEELLEEAAGGGASEKERQRALQVARDRERLAELLAQPVLQMRRKFVDVAARLKMLEEAEAERAVVAGKGAGGGAQGAEARRVLKGGKRKGRGVQRKGGVVG